MVKGKQQPRTQASKKQPPGSKQSGATSSPSAASVSSSRKSKVTATASVPSCCGCGIVIGDDIKALQCNKCQTDAWKCIECLALTADLYDQLLLQPPCGLCINNARVR